MSNPIIIGNGAVSQAAQIAVALAIADMVCQPNDPCQMQLHSRPTMPIMEMPPEPTQTDNGHDWYRRFAGKRRKLPRY